MKKLIIVSLVLGSSALFAADRCSNGYVKMNRDQTISKQPMGNPEGEMRLDVGEKKRLTITLESDYQEELESVFGQINKARFLCLQIDPKAYGNYRLEAYQISSLSQLEARTYADHNMPRLLVIDMKNPFGNK